MRTGCVYQLTSVRRYVRYLHAHVHGDPECWVGVVGVVLKVRGQHRNFFARCGTSRDNDKGSVHCAVWLSGLVLLGGAGSCTHNDITFWRGTIMAERARYPVSLKL